MKEESEPVSEDEVVVRLVWHVFTSGGQVTPGAFKPKAAEATGISVFRAACLTDPLDVLAAFAPDKRDLYGVVLLPVTDLALLNVSVVPAPVAGVSGHALLPEVNAVLGEKRTGPLRIRLADIANRHIVRLPLVGGPPAP